MRTVSAACFKTKLFSRKRISYYSSHSMYIPKILFSSLFQFLLLLHHLLPSAAVDSPLHQICGNTGNYTANSTYQSNLNLILSSLVANASGRGAGFSDDITGQIPNQVSGLVLCRGDVNPSACGFCLRLGASDVLNICPYDTDAVIWYDGCLIRYSNLHFLSSTDNSIQMQLWNGQNITYKPNVFTKMVTLLINTTAHWAAYNTTRRFATVVSNSTADIQLYGLAQCIPDFTSADCWQCLQGLIGEMPKVFSNKGGRILGVWCNFRYELYSFFAGTPSLNVVLPGVSAPAQEPAPAPVVKPPVYVPAREEGVQCTPHLFWDGNFSTGYFEVISKIHHTPGWVGCKMYTRFRV